jgi:hypothetical protein
MDSRLLYFIIGTLAVLVVVLGISLQHERGKTTGISIDVSKEHGLTIEHKKP